jgi:hypothetical protein
VTTAVLAVALIAVLLFHASQAKEWRAERAELIDLREDRIVAAKRARANRPRAPRNLVNDDDAQLQALEAREVDHARPD